MGYSESDYIEICKKQIEDKFSFGNGHGYTQKDLELLSVYIEEQIGISISLSTLKRVWKNNFKQGPQIATLNALVGILGYNNWQHFKIENKKEDHIPRKKLLKPSLSKNKFIALIGIGLILLIFGFFIFSKEQTPEKIDILAPVTFKADKTLTKGTPNTVIFNYDVTNVKADSFFIQQSWNSWRRKKIDPTKNIHSEIYYEAGYHRAKLIANDSIIAKQAIHILSDGWEPHIYYDESDDYFIHFRGESFTNNGHFNISEDLLRKMNVDLTRKFYTRVSHSKKYNISSNNFSFTTKAKLDKNIIEGRNCARLKVFIVTEAHIFYVRLIQKGCEVYGQYKLGEIYKDGSNHDLSLLGRNLFEWQKMEIRVRDKSAQIFINDSLTYSEKFEKDFGDVVGLFYMFEGTGSIDYTKLTDADNNIAFEDDFEE
ncbi:hypothetical protein [Flavivirga eckloniae]|uniref:Uncharacterized protein n=1 Tax=Flavivirga eckloniae TaxID=1803846 RepID=A0A2K9PK11_9FLAO|nr:hypothetical protein [Flavivirga eckloniae]AUP77401.1 hypothetical protein C1H87_01155 [Flavivirga eckloniae]